MCTRWNVSITTAEEDVCVRIVGAKKSSGRELTSKGSLVRLQRIRVLAGKRPCHSEAQGGTSESNVQDTRSQSVGEPPKVLNHQKLRTQHCLREGLRLCMKRTVQFRHVFFVQTRDLLCIGT